MDLNRLPKADEQGTRKVQVDITWRSVFRVLTGVLLGYTAFVLWPIFKLLLLSILLAVALYPVVSWACRKGWPRWVGLLLAAGVLLAVVVGCFAIVGPTVYRQAAVLGDNLPRLRDQVTSQLSTNSVIRSVLEKGMSPEAMSDSQRLLEQVLVVAKTTVGGLVEFLMVLALAVYLMVDGPKAIKWVTVFFPRAQRQKVSRAFEEISGLVFAYVAGQFLISTFAAVYVSRHLDRAGGPHGSAVGDHCRDMRYPSRDRVCRGGGADDDCRTDSHSHHGHADPGPLPPLPPV